MWAGAARESGAAGPVKGPHHHAAPEHTLIWTWRQGTAVRSGPGEEEEEEEEGTAFFLNQHELQHGFMSGNLWEGTEQRAGNWNKAGCVS